MQIRSAHAAKFETSDKYCRLELNTVAAFFKENLVNLNWWPDLKWPGIKKKITHYAPPSMERRLTWGFDLR